MLKIGLTGGIGSGKTLASKVFRELGVPVYVADTEARRLMETNQEVIDGVVRLFGPEAYSDGKLNRSKLAEIVFRDPDLLATLNRIVHPAVRTDFETWSIQHTEKVYVVEEAAILFESGGHAFMDYIIFVKADMEQRIMRVMNRDHISRAQVEQRIARQMPEEEKEKLSDFIIYNDNDSMILPQIVDLHHRFSITKK